MNVVFATVFQENGRLNMVLPGRLKPFEKDFSEIVRLEKARLIHNQRFKNIFAKIDIQPVFMNKSNLKNKNCLYKHVLN